MTASKWTLRLHTKKLLSVAQDMAHPCRVFSHLAHASISHSQPQPFGAPFVCLAVTSSDLLWSRGRHRRQEEAHLGSHLQVICGVSGMEEHREVWKSGFPFYAPSHYSPRTKYVLGIMLFQLATLLIFSFYSQRT